MADLGQPRNPATPRGLLTGGPAMDLDRLRDLRSQPGLTPEQQARLDALIGTVSGALRPEEPSRPWAIPTRAQAEMAGGILGGFVGAPGGVPGQILGAGTFGGGAGLLSDVLRGERPSLSEAAMGFARPAAAEAFLPALGGLVRGGGRLAGAAARRMGLTETVAPALQATERAAAEEILRASERFRVPVTPGDVFGTKRRRALEAVPSWFAIGSNYVQRLRRLQLAGANRGAIETLTEQTRGEVAKEAAAVVARVGIKESAARFREETKKRLLEISQIAGDVEVPVPGLKRLARQMFEMGQQTPLGAPRGAGKLADLGVAPHLRGMREALETGQGSIKMGGRLVPVEKLSADWRDTLLELIDKDTIPFELARSIESELGQLAFGSKRQVVGTIMEGKMGALYDAVKQDINAWLQDDAIGKAVAPPLREFKEWYKVMRALYNDGMVSVFRGMKKESLRTLPDRLFIPGNHQAILDIKEVLSPDAYGDLLQAWAQGFLRKYTVLEAGREAFHAASAGRELQRYIADGTIDLMYGAERGMDIRGLAHLFSALEQAEKIGGVRGSGQAILTSGQMIALGRAMTGLLMATGAGLAGYHGGVSWQAMLPGAASMALVPPAIAVGTMSPLARRVGIYGVGPMTRAAGQFGRRAASQVGAQLAAPEE